MLRSQTGEQRVQALKVGRDLDFVIEIVLNSGSFMRRQSWRRGCHGGQRDGGGKAQGVAITAFGPRRSFNYY